MEFSEWIVLELEKRGWSRSEAARRGDISPSMFDKVINGSAKPGLKFIDGLAKAFKISRAEVMAHSEKRMHQKATPSMRAVEFMMADMSDEAQKEAEEHVRIIRNRIMEEQEARKREAGKKPRATSAS